MAGTEAIDSRLVGIAAFQTADIQDDVSAATAVLVEGARVARSAGARIAVFPECFLTGYTRDAEIAAARGVDLTGSMFKSVLEELTGSVAIMVFGLIERRNDHLFNTVVFVENGKLLGAYRKRHPNEGCFIAGDELPIFELHGLRLGIGICADARDVADAAVLARAQVDVVLYPLNNMLSRVTADCWRDRHLDVLTDRAVQTGAWVISSDVTGNRADQLAYGCTAALSPQGELQARVVEGTEDWLAVHIAP